MEQSVIEKENERLRAENARLQQEIEIEERVGLRWKAVAGIFHDALWNTLRRYDPQFYEQMKDEKCAHVCRKCTDGECL